MLRIESGFVDLESILMRWTPDLPVIRTPRAYSSRSMMNKPKNFINSFSQQNLKVDFTYTKKGETKGVFFWNSPPPTLLFLQS